MTESTIPLLALSGVMFVGLVGLIVLTFRTRKCSRELAKMQEQRDLQDFIAQSLGEWPVEKALNSWFETATSEGLAKYTLEDWLKTALTNWQVRDVLRNQISDIVETEVRNQLLDARLKAA